MKINIFTICLSIFFILSSCSEEMESRESLSSVREADQSTRDLISSVNTWNKETDLSQVSQEEFLAFIYSTNPNLDRDVVRDLTNYGKIEPGERISLRYHYFNKKGVCRMENSEGEFTKVEFKDEIVVEVIRPNNENLWISIACLNGMLDISGESVISGDASMKFTIEKGQGLSRYLADDYWSINVAEEFNLPLFKGKRQNKNNLITPSQARALVPSVNETQITVFVKEGWVFILSDNNWTLNGKASSEFR